ncbi:hypothetical protein SORBI_3004G120400 [Sorghum bicolor]|uniref:Ubiquitin-like protease family profile domain-containing protein n=1 Tax=Sorghum bicolor TaxID=4558 RepID=A0A194YP40_SORBI|nr:hypothetical protein SORBI_3004G120400 [Sorghum bicolor]
MARKKNRIVAGNEDEEVSGNEDGEVSRNEDEEYKDDGGNQDEDDDALQTKGKKKKCNIGSHCEPNSIIKAVDALSDSAKSVVRASGFGAFLRMDITTLYSIDTIMYLMNNCDVSSDGESFTVVVSEDNQIEVTPEFVKECFGIPDGDKSLEDHWGNEYNKFWQRMKDLGYAVTAKVNSRGKIQENKKLPITEIIEYIKTVKDKHSEARAFFMILLCKMLLPTQSNVPTPQHVGMCSYIDEAKSYNWCKYICQNLKSKISTWKQREKQPSKIEGCALLLLMCLHQALKPQLALDGTQADPLINRYNDKTIAKLVKGMNLRQEKHIVIVGKFTIVFTLVAFQVVKHKDNIVKKPVQKPASRKQKVVPLPATKGPSKNLEVRTRTSTSLRFYHEVDKDEEGILLKEMKSCQDKLMEALKEHQIKNNENLKKIAEEHSYLSKMYKEIKRRRALVEDVKIEEQMKENCVVEIDGVQIMEDNFVRIFAPGGHLHDDVVGVLRFIWMKSWDDQIVLSMGAVEQLLGMNKRSGYLEREFRSCDIERRSCDLKKTIYVPFCKGTHWSLVVVEPDLDVITVFDSYYDLEKSEENHQQLINALKNHLGSLGLQGPKYIISTPEVQKQNNLDDCGFHMLMYIMQYKDGNYNNISEDEICMCRKRIARFLLEHEDNKFRGAFSNKHVKTTKKQPEKKATKSDEDKVKGTKDGDKGEFQRIQGEFQRIQATYSRLDGRSIPSALDCSLRRRMKVQVDRSASPFTKPDGITQNLGDKDMRLQLFNKIIDNEELSSVSFLSLRHKARLTDQWQLSGHDISKNFGEKNCSEDTVCVDTVMSFYIRCLIADETEHGSAGYRIFLDPKISELILVDTDNYNAENVAEELKYCYSSQDILRARHIFLPVCYQNHWTLYVINKNYEQIDILDSLANKKYHYSIAGAVRTKLSAVISIDNLWYLIHHKLNGSRDTLPEGIIQDHGSSP